MNNDNKKSPQIQEVQMKSICYPIDTPFAPANANTPANSVQIPMPREFNGKKYYGAADVAKILGVTRQNVSWWHTQGLFTADERAHDGRYLYEVERVMQLKAVYHKDWMRGGYQPSPTTTAPTNTWQAVKALFAEMKDYNHLLLADKEPFHVQKALYDGEMKELCTFVLRLINTLEKEEALGRTFNDATNYERLRLTESEFGWAHGLDLANNFSDGLAVGHFSPTHGGDVCTFNRPGLINFINFTLKGKRDCIQRYLDAEHAGQRVDNFFLPAPEVGKKNKLAIDDASKNSEQIIRRDNNMKKNFSQPLNENLDAAKERLKFISAEQMLNRGIVQKARHSGYLCPFCGDGSGKDGTGMSAKLLDNGQSWYCGKCNKAYDNIDLLAAFFEKDRRNDFKEIIELGAQLFGVDFSVPIIKKSESVPVVPDKYKNFITVANSRLKNFVDSQGGSWRGLTFDTLNRYFCGYANCFGMSGEPSLPHVIIPSSFNQYLSRLVGKPEDYTVEENVSVNPKPHHGPKELFGLKPALNDDDIIFLVEGEIDAMSIWQASGFNVISICGSALPDKMRDQLKNIGVKNFIVLLDNDETGKEKSSLVVSALNFIGHNAGCFSLSDKFKDANEFLQADPKGLADRLKQIYSEAENVFKADSLFDERLADWQELNGVIDPKLLPKLKAAQSFIEGLTVQTFSPAMPFEFAVREKVALCKFYLPDLALKFFDTLKEAKLNADDKIKALSSQSPPAVIPHDLKSLAGLAPSEIKKEIDSLVAVIRKKHKNAIADREIAELNAKRDAQKKELETLNESTAKNVRDCPLDLKIPEYCHFNEHGVQIVDFSGRFAKSFTAAQAPLIPTKILREPHKHTTQYEVAVKTKGAWRRVIVDGDELADSKKILRLAKDGGALIEDPKCLTKFFARIIKTNEERLPEINCYSQPGWQDRDFKFFAYPTGSDDYIVRRPGFDYQEIFAQSGDRDLWKETFLKACKDGGALVRIFLGYALAAPLVRPLNILNPQIHLSAPNDSGKTGLQKLGASIYGNPSEMMKSFAATPKNSISVAAASNDLPSFFDELETLKKAKEDTVAQMVYEFAQGVANQANKRDGTPRPTVRFKGTKLSTAERPMLKSHDQRGAFKRLVQLDTRDKIFADEFATNLHFITEHNFGYFGKTWIEFVTEHLSEIKDKYLEFGKLFAELPDKKNFEPTLLKSVAVASLSIQFFFITIEESFSFDNVQFCNDIREIAKSLPAPSDLDDGTRALADLQSFIAGHDKFFSHEADNKPEYDNEFVQNAFECYGKIFKNGEVAFFPTALKKILETELGFASADALIAEWANKDLLRCSNGDGLRFSTRINGNKVKAYRFKARVLLSE